MLRLNTRYEELWLEPDKYVPSPKKEAVLSDLFLSLKRFSIAVRWKEFFLRQAKDKDDQNLKQSDNNNNKDNEGLSTGLGPQIRSYAHMAQTNLRPF